MTSRNFVLIQLLILLILLVPARAAEFTYEQVAAINPFPEGYSYLSRTEKLRWLENEVSKPQSALKTYVLTRQLAIDLTNHARRAEAAEYCNRTPPLVADYEYRGHCLLASISDASELELAMFRVTGLAERNGHLDDKAYLLNRLAWWMSQTGEIARAFAYYEEALASVPNDNKQLLNKIMFDSATNYIAHGDEQYINRGINLMEKFRESRQQELSQVTEEGRRSRLLIDINLSYFNSGIAYLLHLENYQAAIDMFEPLLELNDDISANALTFSAYSAAKIGNIELAQQLLPRAENERDGNDSIDHYLACYRRLTEQVWQPTLDMSDCLNIADDTALEVKIPLFKTLAENSDEKIKIYGLTKLRDLFVSDIEKKLRKQTSQSASNVEIKRLQRESDLKTVVLEQQKQLQTALDEKHENRTKLFLAIFVIFLFMIFFIFNRFKHKKVLAEQFERMSLRDALTKVGNRRFLEQNIERELAFVRRQYEQDQSTYLAFFIFDVDHFKKVNDTYGHSVGDEVLVEMAQRVGDLVRDTDLFVRWGGEEFIGIFRLSNKQHAVLLADRILTCINERPFSVNHGREQLSISCSIGVTLFPFINTENINDWTKLVSLADLALYHGKSIGRNCWVLIENVGIQNESEVNSLMNQPLEQSIAKGIVNVRTSRDQRLP